MAGDLLAYSRVIKDDSQDGIGRYGKYFMKLSIGDYTRPKPFDTAEMKPEKYIYLPLPQELRDDTGVSYNNVDLQTIGDLMNNNIDGDGLSATVAAGALRNSGDIISGAANAVGGMLPGLGIIGKLSDKVMNEALDPQRMTSAISQGLGVSANPNPSVMFTGPRLRELNFNWVLLPTNEADSKNIRKIVSYLKASSLPTNTIKGSASVLDYPKMVRINFYPWDKGGSGKYHWTEKSIIRVKHCFMSSVNVNYTNGSLPAFYEGEDSAPAVVSLSINFVEAEYFLSHDWQSDGTDYGGGKTVDEFIQNAVDNTSKALSGVFDDVGSLLSSGEVKE